MKATHGGIVLIWDHECPATELHLTEFLNQLDASTGDTQFLVSPQRGRFVMLSVIHGGGELDFRSYASEPELLADLSVLLALLKGQGHSPPIIDTNCAPSLREATRRLL